MKKIIIGGLAVLLGVSGVSHYFFTLMGIIAGALPVILILGGLLAVYLGYTDLRAEDDYDTASSADDDTSEAASDPVKASEPDTEPDENISVPAQEPAPETVGNEEKPAEDEVPVLETPQEETPAAPSLFKGNTDTLVFHSIDCKFSQGKKCTVEFETRESAIEQGYTPCKVCKP